MPRRTSGTITAPGGTIAQVEALLAARRLADAARQLVAAAKDDSEAALIHADCLAGGAGGSDSWKQALAASTALKEGRPLLPPVSAGRARLSSAVDTPGATEYLR